MDTINNVAEAPLIGTGTLSTAPTKDNIVNMLAVNFTLLLCLFKQLFSTRFRTLSVTGYGARGARIQGLAGLAPNISI